MKRLITSAAVVAMAAAFSVSASTATTGKSRYSTKYSSYKASQSTAGNTYQSAPLAGILPEGLFIGVTGNYTRVKVFSEADATLNSKSIPSNVVSSFGRVPGYGGVAAPKASKDLAAQGLWLPGQYDQAGLFKNLRISSVSNTGTNADVDPAFVMNTFGGGLIAGYLVSMDSGIVFGGEVTFDASFFKDTYNIKGAQQAYYDPTGVMTVTSLKSDIETVKTILKTTKANKANFVASGATAAGSQVVITDEYKTSIENVMSIFGTDWMTAEKLVLPANAKLVYPKYKDPLFDNALALNHGDNKTTSKFTVIEEVKSKVVPSTTFSKDFGIAGHVMLGFQVPNTSMSIYGLGGYGANRYSVTLQESTGKASKTEWLGSFRLGLGASLKFDYFSIRGEYVHAFETDKWAVSHSLADDKFVVERGGLNLRTTEEVIRLGLVLGL